MKYATKLIALVRAIWSLPVLQHLLLISKVHRARLEARERNFRISGIIVGF